MLIYVPLLLLARDYVVDVTLHPKQANAEMARWIFLVRVASTQGLRLGRPCGKPLAFRAASFKVRGYASMAAEPRDDFLPYRKARGFRKGRRLSRFSFESNQQCVAFTKVVTRSFDDGINGHDKCRVVWIADLMPNEAATTIEGLIEQALATMKKTLES